MPNRFRRNSVVDMIAKVPVNRGSLLKSIENLLKTIESSENAVMIPTLLRDKVRVDAWELLFVAKILKASILGHTDLVEFYMNHIGQSAAALASTGQQQHQAYAPSAYGATTTPSTPTEANLLLPQLSLSTLRQTLINGQQQQQQQLQQNQHLAQVHHQQLATDPPTGANMSTTSVSQQQSSPPNPSSSLASPAGSAGNANQPQPQPQPSSPSGLSTASIPTVDGLHAVDGPLANGAGELLAKSATGRQAQPPSLLQLTTTNNHINSVAAANQGLTQSPTSNGTNNVQQQLTLDQLMMQQQQQQQSPNGYSPLAATNLLLDGALSISTGVHQLANLSLNTSDQANGHSAGNQHNAVNNHHANATTPTTPRYELRTSRSAGCLFRNNNYNNTSNNANSGASSPRTPTTPCPQAETLANGQSNGLVGDPSAPVRLLLQIEQLKASIGHVTTLLESVVELYKKSIDQIAQ